MKITILLFSLLIFFSVQVFSQQETDLELRGLKSSVKQIEDFGSYFEGDKDNKTLDEQEIYGITNFNRAGNITDIISLSGDYKKLIYFYDNNDKKTFIEEYISSKKIPGRNLVVVTEKSWSYSPEISQLKETLSSRTYYKNNENNEEIEETIKLPKGNVIEKKVFVYNKDGKIIKFTIYNSDNSPINETIINYKNNGRISESIRSENGIENARSISYYDSEGRKIKNEEFRLIPTEDVAIKKDFFLTHTWTIKYEGKKTIMESISFDISGVPTTKVISIDNENDDEISCETFKYLIPPDKNAKPAWQLTEREIREYEYDKNGNWTKSIWRKQEGENEPLLQSSMQERVISYY